MTPRHQQQHPAPNAVLERQVAQLVERINALVEASTAASVPRFAVTIEDAATCLGMSISQFRRMFIDSGRLRSVPMGERARAIDVAELRAAYERYKEETRAG